MSKISIIVPVYNVDMYLHECVESILNQSLSDFNIILVNDGSSDNSPSICDEYAKKDKRVVVIHKENGGLFSARNAGLDFVLNKTNSEYICFVDSDDYLAKDFLKKMFEIILETNSDISYCPCYRFGFKDNKEEKKIYYNYYDSNYVFPAKERLIKMMNNEVGGHVCFALFKSYLFNNLYFPKLSFREDLPLHCEILLKAKQVCYLNEPLYFYRVNYSSLTRNGVGENLKKYFRFKNYCLLLETLNKTDEKDSILILRNLYTSLSNNLFSFLINSKIKDCYYVELENYAQKNRKNICRYSHSSKSKTFEFLYYWCRPLFCFLRFFKAR